MPLIFGHGVCPKIRLFDIFERYDVIQKVTEARTHPLPPLKSLLKLGVETLHSRPPGYIVSLSQLYKNYVSS